MFLDGPAEQKTGSRLKQAGVTESGYRTGVGESVLTRKSGKSALRR